jgi:iron complex transport system permease protein
MSVTNIQEAKREIDYSKKRYLVILLTLIIALFLSIICGIVLGPVKIQIKDVYQIIVNQLMNTEHYPVVWKLSTESIVWYIRCPRVIMGMVAGMGLALSGVAMQTLTKNALAGPYVLGISSGASTGAVAVLIMGTFSSLGYYTVSIGAFIGALISALIVFSIAKTNGEFTATKLVLTGMAVSAIFTSFTNILVFSAKDEQVVRSALYWMTGSVAGIQWEQLWIPTLIVVMASLVLYVLCQSLNGLLLGDTIALTIGVNVPKMRQVLIVFTTLLTAVIVSFTGVIGFVGLVVPHGARTMVGADHKKVIPVSCLLGAILLLWADIGARMIFAPEEIPIGVITALVGAPFFLWLLKGGRYNFGGNR